VFDSYSTAFRPRYDNSTIYVTTVWRYVNSIVVVVVVVDDDDDDDDDVIIIFL